MAPPDTDLPHVSDDAPTDSETAPAFSQPAAEAGGPEEGGPPPDAPPSPPRRGVLGKIFPALLALALLLVGGGYAAIQFKDQDARLRAVADYIENGLSDASSTVDQLQQSVVGLFSGEKPAQSGKLTTRGATAVVPPPASVSEPDATIETPPEPAPTQPPEQTPAPLATPLAEPVPPAGTPAFERRIEQLEQAAQKALQAAEEARTVAARAAETAKAPGGEKQSADPNALTAAEQLAALEGRIDELANEIKAVRERLDSPKSATRAAPEAPEAKGAGGSFSGPAAVVVVAYALQHELATGRPFAAELAALKRLGADEATIAALEPSAADGAPSAKQLLESFKPVARRLRALQGGSVTEHLMQGASKLVRIRPSGEAPVETLGDMVDKIDAALTHDDLVAAEAIFERLPDNAKAEAKTFGETLHRRNATAQAADNLLNNAIAALGGAKK